MKLIRVLSIVGVVLTAGVVVLRVLGWLSAELTRTPAFTGPTGQAKVGRTIAIAGAGSDQSADVADPEMDKSLDRQT